MQVQDIMTTNAVTIDPEASLYDAAVTMQELDIGFLPVCVNAKIEGSITDRDIVLRSTARGEDPNYTKVCDIMTKDPVFVFADQDVREAAQLMEQKQIRRVLVLDRDMSLVGVVSLGDLSTQLHDAKLSGHVLEQISEARPTH